ncbi:MAG: DUF3458 domain-containing protein, partial [Desulfobacteraceae bacterium]|nr:DUF3458 domain-containing protein [Desulfobacteraceae bacterium]
VRMIHSLIGEERFKKGIDLYFNTFDGMAVTIEDFVGVMEHASGFNLEQFKLWYFQSGTPTITMKRSYNSKSQQLSVRFTQDITPDRNQSEKKPLHIPINFGILDSKGNDVTPKGNSLLELKTQKDTFIFDEIPKGCIPSIFRQFSAPVKIKTDFSDEELSFLMAHDTDEFNKWDAAQTLFINGIKQIIKNIQKNQKLSVSPNLINAFKKALIDPDMDRAFLTKMLSLPLETEIKNHFELVDVEAIHQSRQFLKQEITGQLKSHFKKVIDLCSTSDPLSISHEAMADRSLKNLCLSYLGSLKEKETTKFIEHHYDLAKNMTDELAGFKILSEINEETKFSAVNKFYTKWKHDKLVLDKWFAVQAGSTLSNTLETVKALMRHPDFSMKNPNKVRSLIYMFAMQNHHNFHQKNGAGYQFVSDQILLLDGINHQVAGRLSSCFNHWKKYDDSRKTLMKNELERILSAQTLSKNVYEIVSRALE